MIYPCGWWELDVLVCRCAQLDMLGYLLKDGDPIIAKDKFLIEHVTRLRIEYIRDSQGTVKFSGKRRIDDGNGGHIETWYTDDNHGELSLSQIIGIKAFRAILPSLRYFLMHTRPKLNTLRNNSLILKFLPLVAIRRFSLSLSLIHI